MRLTGSFVAASVLFVAACGTDGVAQAPKPQSKIFSRAPLSGNVAAIDVAGISFSSSEPVDFATGRAVFGQGASTGWHEHPGPGFVQVKSGTMTMYHADCSKLTFKAGQAFFDRPGELLLARNDGDSDLVLYFTFVLPRDAEVSTPEKAPAACADVR